MNNHLFSCTHWEEKLALRPEDLSPSERIALNTHLRECPACSKIQAENSMVVRKLHTLPPPEKLPPLPLFQPKSPARPKIPSISVVIPARNEALNLPYVLPHIPSIVNEVILVDGHSTDDTISVAQQLLPNIKVIEQQEKGKGNALRQGFAAASGDIIVMLDADGSTDPREIPLFVETLLRGNDFAKGSRHLIGGGSHDTTLVRHLGNYTLSILTNILFLTKFSDLCYGFNAFWKHCLEYIDIDCDGFEIETLISIHMHKANLKIAEVPSIEYPRIHGTSNLHAIRDGWLVLLTIIKARLAGRIDRNHQSVYVEIPKVVEHSYAK